MCNHLGVSSVSKEFILNEIEEMKKIGFNSSIIKDHTGEVIGLCDFKISHEVYLSLLMEPVNNFVYSKFPLGNNE